MLGLRCDHCRSCLKKRILRLVLLNVLGIEEVITLFLVCIMVKMPCLLPSLLDQDIWSIWKINVGGSSIHWAALLTLFRVSVYFFCISVFSTCHFSIFMLPFKHEQISRVQPGWWCHRDAGYGRFPSMMSHTVKVYAETPFPPRLVFWPQCFSTAMETLRHHLCFWEKVSHWILCSVIGLTGRHSSPMNSSLHLSTMGL